MKAIRILLSFLLTLSLCLPATAGSVTIKGAEQPLDTLDYRVLGPGIEYLSFCLPEQPLYVYLLKTDLNNPYNTVETFQAQEQVGKTEAMTTAYSRLDSEGHRTIAGVNANFWIVSNQGQPNELLGVPHSGSMRNGEIVTDPNGWNRGNRGDTEEEKLREIGFAMLDGAKKMWIDDVYFEGKVRLMNATEYSINEINRIRSANELVLFNSYLGKGIPTRTDDDGTEVFFKPMAPWGVNKGIRCKVSRIIKGKGANVLEDGEYALSGNGTAQAFLDVLAVGDEFDLSLGVSTRIDGHRPSVEQMVTGNALVMKNGKLTQRNANEEYNSMLYPRTGIGTSADGKTLYLMVIDKRGMSSGADTETMCELMKAYGAVDVTSMDGGGSAQMMIEGSIVSVPNDGRERPVANGWFLYHNAPDDLEVTRLRFRDFKLEVPVYASYKPVIYGYNQYGVLVDKNVKGYTLSCPAEVGTIVDGALIASGESATGILEVEYNGARETMPIHIVPGDISLRLDSVVLDSRSNHAIQILSSTASGKSMPVDPSVLTWQVADNTVCEVVDGALHALKNGTTEATGRLDGKELSFKVMVETPESSPILADVMTPAEWKMTATKELNARWSEENRPAGWEHGGVVSFTYTEARSPNVKLAKDVRLYGLADTLLVRMNIGSLKLEKGLVYLRANNGKSNVSKEFTVFEQDRDFTLSIPLDELFDVSDRGIFPVVFKYAQFYTAGENVPEGTPCIIAIKDLSTSYVGIPSPSGFASVYDGQELLVYPNPLTGDYLYVHLAQPADCATMDIAIYSLSGRCIHSAPYAVDESGRMEVSVKDLPEGMYLLRLSGNEQTKVVKIIK